MATFSKRVDHNLFPRNWREATQWLLPMSILLLTTLVYVNSFPGQFILDDHRIVLFNPLLDSADWKGILQTDYWGPGENSGLYRPLTIFSLYINRLLLGPSAWGFHLVNVLLHAGVSALIWLVLRKWMFGTPIAWLSAALFAVHPIHTEVVNEVVGRSELLAALFLLLALVEARGRGTARGIAAGAFFLLALLSKEHAITFILLLPAIDAFAAGSAGVWRHRWRLYAGLGITAAIWLAWRQWGVIRAAGAEVYDPVYAPLAYMGNLERILAALKLQWLYIGKLSLPLQLQGVYSGPEFPGAVSLAAPVGWMVCGGFILLLLLCRAGWRRKLPAALFGLVYFISFAPTSNVLFPIGATFAERFAYFPSIWFCAAFAALLFSITRSKATAKVAWWGGLTCVLLLGVTTLARNPAFGSELRLWQEDIRRDPGNVVAWQSLGETLAGDGRFAEAEQAFRRALELKPDSAVTLHVWAKFLLKTDRPTDAIEAARTSMDQQMARHDRPRATANMGIIVEALLQLGAFAEALHWLDSGARFDREVQGLEMRGQALAGLERCGEAAEVFAKIPAWEYGPGVPLNYGLCLLKLDRLDEAGDVLELALNERNNAAAWNALGVVRSMQNRQLEALAAFEKAAAQAPGNSFYLANLQRMREKVSLR